MPPDAIYISQVMGWSIPKAICDYFQLDDAIAYSNFNAHRYGVSSKGLYKLADILANIYSLLTPLADKYTETKDSRYELAYKLVNGKEGVENTKENNELWMSLICTEILVPFAEAMKALIRNDVDSTRDFDAKKASLHKSVGRTVDMRLTNHDYLGDEGPSLADFFACFALAGAFKGFWSSEWIDNHPVTFEWFEKMQNHPFSKSFFADSVFAAKHSNSSVPKANENSKKAKEKEVSRKSALKFIERPKHPLELLGPSEFKLNDWKKKYANDDTRSVALPWFWEHYNPKEYSIWKVSYKYNDELTLTFMSSNLVNGFINRLIGSIEYMFGCFVIYGENNNNGITGAVMVRGQEFKPAFDVAPDWEFYDYEKLDVSVDENKEFVNNMWAWDKPLMVE
ncbi:hypothetical protein ACO0QE_000445 [Hanseniaspora vineae]